MKKRTIVADKDLLDLVTYTSPNSDFTWWFDWCRDQEPHTFWDRRLEKRRQSNGANKNKRKKK